VEVIAALAIVSIALLGLLRLHLTSVKMAETAQARTQAVFLARAKITETLCSEYRQTETKEGTAETDGLNFAWRTELTSADLPQLGKLGLRTLQRLRVNVSWREGDARKSVELTTYVADSKTNE
jgi:hypothetical protein